MYASIGGVIIYMYSSVSSALVCAPRHVAKAFPVMVMYRVWAANGTVEPLLYDHPQNHIGVVV